jgi:hypothetical protein
MQRPMKLQKKATTLSTACIIFICTFLMACSDGQEPSQTGAGQDTSEESFTFFDLGAHTKLTGHIRKELEEKLGSDAIAHRNIIDLEINYRGFLKKYFPDLNRLNRRLNYPPGERVEHNTVKLMYRYARKKNVPFEYVELVFSDYTNKPLFFRIHFRKDDANIVETLKIKYGQPQVIDWKEENGSSMYWKKNMDYLVVSLVPDQFGNHEYQIVIYFVKNLINLVDTEQKAEVKREEKRVESGKSAF